MPGYEIWQWSEDYPCHSQGEKLVADRYMVFDVDSIPYTAEAYKQKKYAFVSDYCRFVAIYEYGGIYFDTDVEVIRSLCDIIDNGSFMGFEVDPDGENTPGKYAPRYCFSVNPGVGFGLTRKHPLMKELMELYHGIYFEPIPNNIAWYKTIVAYTTEMLCSRGLKNVHGLQKIDDINIYPKEYFAPIDVITGRLRITQHTYTIHRYMGSWNNNKNKWKNLVRNFIPSWVFYLNNRLKREKYKIKK